MHPMVANPENIAFVPNNCVSFPDRMNFWQRIYNFVHTIFLKFYYYYLTAVQDDIIRQYVGPNMPTVRELEKNVALILVNSHISLNGITSMTPAIVEVGGLHVQDEDLTLQPVIINFPFIVFLFFSILVEIILSWQIISLIFSLVYIGFSLISPRFFCKRGIIQFRGKIARGH